MLVAVEDCTEQKRAQRAAAENEAYVRALFDLSPVSLWVEDFSEVKDMLDDVRAQGITDFRTFVDVHPEFVLSCIERIRVIDVNRQTLALFGAASKDVLGKHDALTKLRSRWQAPMVTSRNNLRI